MKKWIAVLLAVMMLASVFGMTGCDKDNLGGGDNNTTDLYTLVSQAMENSQKVSSYSATITQVSTQSLMGMTMETNMTMNIKANAADSNNPEIGMDGSMTMDGQNIPYAFYFKDGWMYISTYGEGYKMQVTLDEFQQDAGSVEEMFTDLPKELFDGVTAKVENGVTTVELTADSDEFKAMYEKLVQEMFADVLGDDISAVEVSDAKIVISASGGYVRSYDMSFKCSYTFSGETISFTVTQNLVFNSINEDVTITPPEGYESFPEMSMG